MAGVSLRYIYDPNGNILQVRQSPYSTAGNLIREAIIRVNSYSDGNWGDLLTSYGDGLHQENVIYYDNDNEDECTGNPI